MVSDKVKIIGKAVIFYFLLFIRLAIQRVAALLHSWTWRDTADFKNVVVVGGSVSSSIARIREALVYGPVLYLSIHTTRIITPLRR